jgi:hypothetical protein
MGPVFPHALSNPSRKAGTTEPHPQGAFAVPQRTRDRILTQALSSADRPPRTTFENAESFIVWNQDSQPRIGEQRSVHPAARRQPAI